MVVVVDIRKKSMDKGHKPTTPLQPKVFGLVCRFSCKWLYPCCGIKPFIYKAFESITTTTTNFNFKEL